MYFAPGNGHAPHHATKDWIAKFKGQFDHGWDRQREITLANQKRLGIVPADTVLTARPAEIPAWDSLNDDQKKVFARMMEVYAAAVAQSDHEIGRIIDALQESVQLDNTLVIYIEGDNGASAEGTLQGITNEVAQLNPEPESLPFLLSMMDELGSDRTYNHYPVGWAHAMDTPFQWTKQVASHFGGTRNGMAISWPKRIKTQGEIRSQFHHVIDIVPTILEAVGVETPFMLDGVEQEPLQGVSMAYTFDDAKAPPRHTTQYFEITANRGPGDIEHLDLQATAEVGPPDKPRQSAPASLQLQKTRVMQDGVDLLRQHGIDGGDVAVQRTAQGGRIDQQPSYLISAEPQPRGRNRVAGLECRELFGQPRNGPADESAGQQRLAKRDRSRFNNDGLGLYRRWRGFAHGFRARQIVDVPRTGSAWTKRPTRLTRYVMARINPGHDLRDVWVGSNPVQPKL